MAAVAVAAIGAGLAVSTRASIVRDRADRGVKAMATCVFVVLIVVVEEVVVGVVTSTPGRAVGRFAPQRATTKSFVAVEVMVLVVLRGSSASVCTVNDPNGSTSTSRHGLPAGNEQGRRNHTGCLLFSLPLPFPLFLFLLLPPHFPERLLFDRRRRETRRLHWEARNHRGVGWQGRGGRRNVTFLEAY